MPKQKIEIKLSDDEQKQLHALLSKGTVGARVLKRGHIVRLATQGKSDAAIVEALGVGEATIWRTRKRYAEGGLDGALYEKPRPGAARLLDDVGEAAIIALACSQTPNGEARWTLQMLADGIVKLGVVDSISDDTVGRVLKKTRSSRGSTNTGASRR